MTTTATTDAVGALLDVLVRLEVSATEGNDELVLDALVALKEPLETLLAALDPNRTVETEAKLRAMTVRSKLGDNEHVRA